MFFKFYFGLVLLLVLALTGCRRAASVNEIVSSEIPETGIVLDISPLNGTTVTTTPGDVLYLKLSGEGGLGRQWFAQPGGDSVFSLKQQQTSQLEQKNVSSTFEWWFKIEQIGQAELEFDYHRANESARDQFKLNIVSQ